MPGGSDKRDVAELFRERLLLLMRQKDISMSAFASAIDLDRSALSQFLAPGSTRLPRAETLHAIARVCGVSLDWLLGLVSNSEDAKESLSMLEIQHIREVENDDFQLLSQWHKEALGYKIRYVPATLPDLLRTETISQLEFANYSRDEIAAKEEAARYQLTYSRRPETDMEVCMPMQRLQSLANGEGLWANIPKSARREQLNRMADLIDEMYPTFRLFLFDQHQLYASPYTVFGPKRAAIYLGNMYLVVNSLEHIKALAAHFDNLIRIATHGPDRVAGYIRELAKAT